MIFLEILYILIYILILIYTYIYLRRKGDAGIGGDVVIDATQVFLHLICHQADQSQVYSTRGEHSTLYLTYLIGGLEVLTGRQHILSLKKVLLQIDKFIHLSISKKSYGFSFESKI